MLGLGLTKLIPYIIFLTFILFSIVSFKQPKYGLFILVLLAPFRNVQERLEEFPFGKDIIDILFIVVIIGAYLYNVRQGKSFNQNGYNKTILVFILCSLLALVFGSLLWGLGNPFDLGSIRFRNWKNYMMLGILFYMTVNVIEKEEDIKILIAIVVLSLFLADFNYWSNYRHKSMDTFDWSLKAGGIFKTLGGNEFAAWLTHFFFVPLSFLFYSKGLVKKACFTGVALFTLYPILFLFSRGAYVALTFGLIYIGIKKSKMIIIGMVVLFIAWNTLLPEVVVERINMSGSSSGEIDHSSASRFELWKKCTVQFMKNPIFGVGFDTFYKWSGGRKDPHNVYFKLLAEQGLIGLFCFLILLRKTYKNGLTLQKTGKNTFYKGIGLSASAITIAIALTNIFGNRWTYFELSAFFFVYMGIVSKSLELSKSQKPETA